MMLLMSFSVAQSVPAWHKGYVFVEELGEFVVELEEAEYLLLGVALVEYKDEVVLGLLGDVGTDGLAVDEEELGDADEDGASDFVLDLLLALDRLEQLPQQRRAPAPSLLPLLLLQQLLNRATATVMKAGPFAIRL